MKKKTKETILIGAGLVILSLLLHYAHFKIFKDLHHTLIFLFADIAFIPMEVFFTSLILDKFLERREKYHLLEKLNMLIGVFYTEVGTKLLTNITIGDNNISDLTQDSVKEISDDKISFEKLNNDILNHSYKLDINKIDLSILNKLLNENRDLLITLITNENLLEHETFTEMLMSVLHLKEELNSRYSTQIDDYELLHIESDLEVAYKYLTIEWIKYMQYLCYNYPVLFTKALINNPFDNRSKKEKDQIYLKKHI